MDGASSSKWGHGLIAAHTLVFTTFSQSQYGGRRGVRVGLSSWRRPQSSEKLANTKMDDGFLSEEAIA
eukprot:3369863-Pyramimonas_sp.AAC.1